MNASGFIEHPNKKTKFGGSGECMTKVENENLIKRKEINKIIEKYGRSGQNLSIDEESFKPNRIEDYYGFYYSDEIPEKVEASQAKVKLADQKREKKWQKMIDKKYLEKLETKRKLPELNNRRFIRRVFKGIPEKYRMKVWPILLDISSQQENNKRVYQTMLDRAFNTSTYILQIDLDVNRTFRDTTYFQERYGARQRALFHVLSAYSAYNTEIGYCQGMSDIAGLMLMYMSEEEDAFWALSQLISGKKYTMHGMFVQDFPKMHMLFRQLEQILSTHLPKINKHLTQLDLQPSLYAFKWFMQCFLSRLPMSLCLRLWDIYLLEGERVLLAMAYNIFKMHKKKLLKMDYCQVSHFFQNELPKDFLYEDDMVINSLKDCMEELRKSRLDRLPKEVENKQSTNNSVMRPNNTVFNENNSIIYASKSQTTAERTSDMTNTSKMIGDTVSVENTSIDATNLSKFTTALSDSEEARSSNAHSSSSHATKSQNIEAQINNDVSRNNESDKTLTQMNENHSTSSTAVSLPPEQNLTMPQFYYKSAINNKEPILIEQEVKLKVLPHRQINSTNVMARPMKQNSSPKKRNSSASINKHMSTTPSSKDNSIMNAHRKKRISLQDHYFPSDRHLSSETSDLPQYHHYNNQNVKEHDFHNPAYRSVSPTSPNSAGGGGTRFSLLTNRTSKSVSPPPVSSIKENRLNKRPVNINYSTNNTRPGKLSSQPSTPTAPSGRLSASSSSSPNRKSPVNSSPVALNYGVETSL